MSDLPEPLVPSGVDLRGLEWMPLYGHRLFGSDFDAHATDAEFRAGMTLWWAAWNQTPAASLPDDDVALCRLAGMGRDLKSWRKVRARALHGFTVCADGRLYHRALAKMTLEAWDRRVRERERKARWRRRGDGDRDVPETGTTPNVPPSVPPKETAPERMTGEDRTGEDRNISKNTPTQRARETVSAGKPNGHPTAPTGWQRPLPVDWRPTPDDLAWLAMARPDLAPEAEWTAETERFRWHMAENARTTADPSSSWRKFVSKATARDAPADAPYVPLSQRVDLAKLTGSKP